METVLYSEDALDEMVLKVMSESGGEIMTTLEILTKVYGYWLPSSNYREYRPLLASLKRLETRKQIHGRLFPTVGNLWVKA